MASPHHVAEITREFRLQQLERDVAHGLPTSLAASRREENTMGETSEMARQPVRAAAAAFAGTTIEWYDFFVYSTASALVFPQLFFPSSDPTVGLLASFATFAVGFLARPLGGFLFGHFGDRFGRKRALIAT